MHGKWTKENFETHLEENPGLYDLFCKYSKMAASKRPRYSARGIFHQVRWYSMMNEKESDFKIDAGWSSHYAGKFMDDHPEHEGFFETRIRRESYHDE